MKPALQLALLVGLALTAVACHRGGALSGPNHRERAPARDAICAEPGRPHAFFYAAQNRTDYGPEDPKKDGCALAVPDHLFCCPDAPKPTDR